MPVNDTPKVLDAITDAVLAYKWFLLAGGRQDDQDAKEKINLLERVLNRNQISDGQRMAREFKPVPLMYFDGGTKRPISQQPLFKSATLRPAQKENTEAEAKRIAVADAQEKRKAAEYESLRKEGEKGNALAQIKLGKIFSQGEGVPKDQAEAAKWFRKAAEQGHTDGQYELGCCYFNGDGVPKDQAEAVKWHLKAAENGNALACLALGECYANGSVVRKDMHESKKWMLKSAEQGVARAQFLLGTDYRAEIVDSIEAFKWLRKSAEQGYTKAEYFLGNSYKFGDEVKKDPIEAAKWYRKAADKGDAEAQAALGMAYALGEGVPYDLEKAHLWCSKAAKQGDEVSIALLNPINPSNAVAASPAKEKYYEVGRQVFGNVTNAEVDEYIMRACGGDPPLDYEAKETLLRKISSFSKQMEWTPRQAVEYMRKEQRKYGNNY